jgi:hypothetical protein
MKKLLFFLLATAPLMAQTGFKTENGTIVWERFFNTPGANIKSILAANPKLSLTADSESLYTGLGTSVKNTCALGSVLMKCDNNFSFTILPVTDGYMVKVTDFMFLEKYGPMQMRIVPNSLAKYYLEHGKIRTSDKTQTDLSCIDAFLTGVFSGQGTAAAVPAVTAN